MHELIVGRRSGANGDVGESREHAGEVETAVVAVLELGEVARCVPGVDVSVRAGEGGLDVPKSDVHPLERRGLGGTSSTAGDADAVAAAGLDHAGEAVEPIAEHLAARGEFSSGEVGDLGEGEALDDLHGKAPRMAVLVGLDGGHERGLVRRSAPRFPGLPSLLAAEVRVIDLDPIDEQMLGFALLHHVHELVLE